MHAAPWAFVIRLECKRDEPMPVLARKQFGIPVACLRIGYAVQLWLIREEDMPFITLHSPALLIESKSGFSVDGCGLERQGCVRIVAVGAERIPARVKRYP